MYKRQVYDAVEPYLNNAQSWTGEDMAASAEALCQAVNAMAATAADYLSADFPTEAQQPETVQSGEAPELGSTGMNYVFDLRGMLSDGEREELEDRAEDIALRRSCGIYTLFVEDFTAYGYGDDPYTALYQIYHAEGLGEMCIRDRLYAGAAPGIGRRGRPAGKAHPHHL